MDVDVVFAIIIGSCVGLYGVAWLFGRVLLFINRMNRAPPRPRPERIVELKIKQKPKSLPMTIIEKPKPFKVEDLPDFLTPEPDFFDLIEANADLFGPSEQEMQRPVGVATNVKTQIVVVEKTRRQ